MNYYATMLLIFVLSITRSKGSPTVVFDSEYVPINIDDMILRKDTSVTCTENEFINLSHLQLQHIPRKFAKSGTIEAISFDDNEITMIPSNAFDEIPNLKCLSIASNRIPQQQLRINHDNLRTLIVDYQSISETNDLVWEDENEDEMKMYLPNLETLSWKNMNYDFLTKFSSPFLKLANVYFSDSELKYVNKSISTYFPNLRTLHLERNLIDDLGIDCGYLEAIYLDENPLKRIRFWPNQCNLEILSLSSCSLQTVLSLNVSSLKILDLSSNHIAHIPEEAFRDTPFLEKINLSNNKLRYFPYMQHLNSLTILSLNYNAINDIRNITILRSLNMLSLRGNFISRIEEYTFSSLTNLKYLDLSENNLHYLPPKWGQNLHMLTHINLQKNYFKSVENMMVNYLLNLEELYIKNSGVTSISLETLQFMPSCRIHVI